MLDILGINVLVFVAMLISGYNPDHATPQAQSKLTESMQTLISSPRDIEITGTAHYFNADPAAEAAAYPTVDRPASAVHARCTASAADST